MPFRRKETTEDTSSSIMEPVVDENCVPVAVEYLNPTDLYGNIGSSEQNLDFVQVKLKDTGSDAGETSPVPRSTSIEFQLPTLVAIPLQEIDLQFPFFKNQFQYDHSKLNSLEIQPHIIRTLSEASYIMKTEYLRPKTIDSVFYLLFIGAYTLFCMALMILPFLFMFLFTGGIYIGLICLGVGFILGLLGLIIGSNIYRNQIQKRRSHAMRALQTLILVENNQVFDAMGLEWKVLFEVQKAQSSPTLLLKKK